MLKKYEKLIYCILLLFFFSAFTYFLKYYFKPFFVIIILLLLCLPVKRFFKRKVELSNKFSTILSIIVINLLFISMIILLGNFVLGKIILLFKGGIYEFLNNIKIFLSQIPLLNNFIEYESGANILKGFGGHILQKSAMYTSEWLVIYVMANIAVYFLMSDIEKVLNLGRYLIGEETLNIMIRKYGEINTLLRIEFTLVIIVTIETIFGFVTLGINNGIQLGIISGVFDILPYVGSILVFLPLIFLNFIYGEYVIVIGLVCLYILLVISRQVMEAKFMCNDLKIHPFPLILSLYIGYQIFGMVGMFVAPLYVISAKELIFS